MLTPGLPSPCMAMRPGSLRIRGSAHLRGRVSRGSHDTLGNIGYYLSALYRFRNAVGHTPVHHNADSWEGWYWGASHHWAIRCASASAKPTARSRTRPLPKPINCITEGKPYPVKASGLRQQHPVDLANTSVVYESLTAEKIPPNASLLRAKLPLARAR
jgi:hypothetical protein